MPASGHLSVEGHRERAAYHAATGDKLAEGGEDGWAAVCYFYAAYHIMRASLINDPIFDNPTSLSRVNVDLIPEDRFVARHKGQEEHREWT